MDETYIKVKGEWHYLYRAVGKDGDTVKFMLSKKRDEAAAILCFGGIILSRINAFALFSGYFN